MITGRPITQRSLLFGLILFMGVFVTAGLIAELFARSSDTSTPFEGNVSPDQPKPERSIFGDESKPAGVQTTCHRFANHARNGFGTVADGSTDQSQRFVNDVNAFRNANCDARVHTGQWTDLIDVATVALVVDLLNDQLPIYGAAVPKPGPVFQTVIDQFSNRSPRQFCDEVAQGHIILSARCMDGFRSDGPLLGLCD